MRPSIALVCVALSSIAPNAAADPKPIAIGALGVALGSTPVRYRGEPYPLESGRGVSALVGGGVRVSVFELRGVLGYRYLGGVDASEYGMGGAKPDGGAHHISVAADALYRWAPPSFRFGAGVRGGALFVRTTAGSGTSRDTAGANLPFAMLLLDAGLPFGALEASLSVGAGVTTRIEHVDPGALLEAQLGVTRVF